MYKEHEVDPVGMMLLLAFSSGLGAWFKVNMPEYHGFDIPNLLLDVLIGGTAGMFLTILIIFAFLEIKR